MANDYDVLLLEVAEQDWWERVRRVAAAASLTGGYITEDESAFYITEDESAIYVPENF
jgi:hypothetical protein